MNAGLWPVVGGSHWTQSAAGVAYSRCTLLARSLIHPALRHIAPGHWAALYPA